MTPNSENGLAKRLTQGSATGLAEGPAKGLAKVLAKALVNGLATGLAKGLAGGREDKREDKRECEAKLLHQGILNPEFSANGLTRSPWDWPPEDAPAVLNPLIL